MFGICKQDMLTLISGKCINNHVNPRIQLGLFKIKDLQLRMTTEDTTTTTTTTTSTELVLESVGVYEMNGAVI